jgi:UDP-3-O-[3-hydroxymyristoyl] glucosamine N-acyltransferase
MKVNRNKAPNIIGNNVDIEENSLVYNGVKIGDNTRVLFFANLYGCEVGQNCMIGSYVEVQSGAKIGNGVKVGSHSFICDGVRVGDM